MPLFNPIENDLKFRAIMKSFENKVVLITGSTGGIGQATAKKFAEKGGHVIVSGRRAEKGKKVVSEITDSGGKASFVAIDIMDFKSIQKAMIKIKEDFGEIDVLVANAGREQPSTLPINQLEDSEVEMIMDTNLKGTYFTIKYGLPIIRKNTGSICLISSLWGHLGGAGLTAYTSTKGGIIALTRSLAVEQGAAGIRVNCISPGAIETPMLNRFSQGADMSEFYRANMPLGRAGQAEEVAAGIVWISSDEASYVTGQILAIDGGVTSKMSTAGM